MIETLQFQGKYFCVADELTEKILKVAARASRTQAPVMIVGESGTGKELIARFIHEKSARQNGPFVSINCAAVPDGLLEAEFFGYERGAFTGAVSQKLGKFEQANRGTFLLDEISEMPFSLQAKLLRSLQEGEVDRLGGQRPIRVNARVISTTNRDPRLLIRGGTFREDLFYRLNVIRIDCPPLRGRANAIRELAVAFANSSELFDGVRVTLSPEALQKLALYHWPGNIRELKNAVDRAILQSENGILEKENFSFLDQPFDFPKSNKLQSLFDLEREHIFYVLDNTAGNRTQAAKILGITARTLRNKLKIYSGNSG